MSFDKYEHKNVENKIYDYWEKKELFKPKQNSKKFNLLFFITKTRFSLEATPGLEPGYKDLQSSA